MLDMLDLILKHALNPNEESFLRQEIMAHSKALRASEGSSDGRQLVKETEQQVQNNPTTAFNFDSHGFATLTVGNHTWKAGRFETVSIRDLKTRAEYQKQDSLPKQIRLWFFNGTGPVVDIGSLQATSPNNTLFQVASQFNCLESPEAYLAPVADYFFDSTQGPRASISAFPGTLLRHYAAPDADGKRFVQETNQCQIDLLADAVGSGITRNGYLKSLGGVDPQDFASTLETHFEAIRLGVHDRTQVVFGYNWDGYVEDSKNCLISQVFTSTIAGGFYGGQVALGAEVFEVVCLHLLRAAYLGTLLSASCLDCTRVVLTLIGGGVFGNPFSLIWKAIHWTVSEVSPFLSQDLDVVVNGWNIGSKVDLETAVLPTLRDWNGAILSFDNDGNVTIRR